MTYLTSSFYILSILLLSCNFQQMYGNLNLFRYIIDNELKELLK